MSDVSADEAHEINVGKLHVAIHSIDVKPHPPVEEDDWKSWALVTFIRENRPVYHFWYHSPEEANLCKTSVRLFGWFYALLLSLMSFDSAVGYERI